MTAWHCIINFVQLAAGKSFPSNFQVPPMVLQPRELPWFVSQQPQQLQQVTC